MKIIAIRLKVMPAFIAQRCPRHRGCRADMEPVIVSDMFGEYQLYRYLVAVRSPCARPLFGGALPPTLRC